MTASIFVVAAVGVAGYLVRSGTSEEPATAGGATAAAERQSPSADEWITLESVPQPELTAEEDEAEVAQAAQDQAQAGLIPVEQPAGASTLGYATQLTEQLTSLGVVGEPTSALDEVMGTGEVNSRLLSWDIGEGASVEVIVNYLREPLYIEALGPADEVVRESLQDGTILLSYSTHAFAQTLRVFPDGTVVNVVSVAAIMYDEESQVGDTVAQVARQAPTPPNASSL